MSVFQDISNTWKCLVYGSVLFLRCPDRKKGYKAPPTWSGVQKMWASSCWNRRTRVRPVRAPDTSLRWRTPKSAILRGNSLHDLLLVLLFTMSFVYIIVVYMIVDYLVGHIAVYLLVYSFCFYYCLHCCCLPGTMVKHETVTRTVHWFQGKDLFLDFDLEHVLLRREWVRKREGGRRERRKEDTHGIRDG